MAGFYRAYTYKFKQGDSRSICRKSVEAAWSNFSRSNVQSVEFTEGITEVGSYFFSVCSKLQSVVFPSTLSSIHEAFDVCRNLSSITIKATTPPVLEDGSLGNDMGNFTIYVPSSSVDAYKAASGWTQYSDRIQAIA